MLLVKKKLPERLVTYIITKNIVNKKNNGFSLSIRGKDNIKI